VPFEAVCKSRWFVDTPIILLLNKIDLFAEKLLHSPVGEYFPEYLDRDNYDATCDYLRDKFPLIHKRGATTQIYTHYICADGCPADQVRVEHYPGPITATAPA